MTQQIQDALKKIGLSEKEIEVFIFLTAKGSQKGTDIAKELKMYRGQVYRILKRLERGSFIEATLERPKRFIARPFEEVIDSFIKSKKQEVERIERSKKKLLFDWEKIELSKPESSIEKLSIIEGKKKVFNKISQMMSETKRSFYLALTVSDLFRIEQYGVFDAKLPQHRNSQPRVKILTQLSAQNLELLRQFNLNLKSFVNMKARNPCLGFPNFSRMIIRDEEEIMLIISKGDNDFSLNEIETCLVTTCKSIIQSFLGVFEELWQDSTNIKQLIALIETGHAPPKTKLIRESKSAKEYYHTVMNSAKDNVVLITSSEGLIRLSKNKKQLEHWAKAKVTIKIMAPITYENLDNAQQLLEFAEVRHVPVGYFETSIIDGQHLFQNKHFFEQVKRAGIQSSFDNTLYTNDLEYIEKTKNILDKVWKKTHTPSSQGLRSIQRIASTKKTYFFHTPILEKRAVVNNVEYPQGGTITREDVVEKINSEKKRISQENEKESNLLRFFGNVAWALIHPPKRLELPEMIFGIYQMEKDSSCGRQNFMIIDILQDSPEGKHFIPVAMIQDTDELLDLRKKVKASLPVGKNIRVVKNENFQVKVKGSTLFAGWTVPIPLIPSKHVLPPAVILFEGYGRMKSGMFTADLSTGENSEIWFNSMDAFVTLFLPSLECMGSGTEGFFDTEALSITRIPNC